MRDRGDDILHIADYFLQQFASEEGKAFTGFDENANAHLLNFTWPGNIRELQNTLRNAIVLNDGPIITRDMLFKPVREKEIEHEPMVVNEQDSHNLSAKMSARNIDPLWLVEQRHIKMSLEICEGNIARAAAMLEIGASTLYRKFKEMQQS